MLIHCRFYQEIAGIKAYRKILNEMFKTNFAKSKVPLRLTDKKLSTFLTIKPDQPFNIDFKKQVKIDRAMLQENIANDNRFQKPCWNIGMERHREKINHFTTVRYKRLLRYKLITLQK